MRLGLLADIHEEVEFLAEALARFDRAGVDEVIVLGDVSETGRRLDATAAMLADAGAVGVWGNHDLGICRGASEVIRARYAPSTVGYMATLKPRLERDGCLFTHVEPWLDPEDIRDLQYFAGPPSTPEELARSFDAVPHRLILIGHFHRWSAHDRSGRLGWDCFHPLRLDPGGRYLIAVGPVVDGRCGILDISAGRLEPIDLRDG